MLAEIESRQCRAYRDVRLGYQKRTCAVQKVMSALPPDIRCWEAQTIPLHPFFSTAPERTSPPGSDPDDNLDCGREAVAQLFCAESFRREPGSANG